MVNNVPNLDCTDPDELMTFWARYQYRSRKSALALFGEKFPGYIRAMNDLANYASNKATAMRQRAQGNIITAEQYEKICDSIYSTLPPQARW